VDGFGNWADWFVGEISFPRSSWFRFSTKGATRKTPEETIATSFDGSPKGTYPREFAKS